MIVLDASVLIAHLDATDAHHDRACELLLLAADQGGDAVATFDDRLADAASSHGLAVWGRVEFTTGPRGSPESPRGSPESE